MVNTLYLPLQLKEKMEYFIRNNDPSIEHGGFILGKDFTLFIPRFFPNISKTPQREYYMEPNYLSYLNLDIKLFGYDFIVNFHTHPHHTITSEADLKYAQNKTLFSYNIVIVYDAPTDKFTWHSYNNSGIEQILSEISKDFPVFQEYFAKSLGLISLGQCYVTEKGELLSDNPLGKAAITINVDFLRLLEYFKQKKQQIIKKSGTGIKSKAKIAEELNISPYYITKYLPLLESLKKELRL